MKDLYKVKITGTGTYFPERLVTNDDLSKVLDTNDEWITKRTGIRQRYYAAAGDSTASFGARAAKVAMERAGVGPDDIDFIVFATVTPDFKLPFCAALAQRELGLTRAFGFDLTSGCAGYVQALHCASTYIKAGSVKTALVIGADLMTSIIDQQDRRTAVLFGDGGGAVVLQRTPEGEDADLLSWTGGLKGDDEVLLIKNGGSRNPLTPENLADREQYVFMNGREIFRFAVDRFSAQMEETCKEAGISPEQLKIIVPHQVNQRILDMAAKKAGISIDKVMINLDRYGNTSGATVPSALHDAVEAGRIERGDYVLTVAFGSGLAWHAALFQY